MVAKIDSRKRRPLGGAAGQGFTLLELVVVIAVIAILAGLPLLGLSRAREQAKAALCQNNLRQLQLAFQLYAGDHGRMPHGSERHSFAPFACGTARQSLTRRTQKTQRSPARFYPSLVNARRLTPHGALQGSIIFLVLAGFSAFRL